MATSRHPDREDSNQRRSQINLSGAKCPPASGRTISFFGRIYLFAPGGGPPRATAVWCSYNDLPQALDHAYQPDIQEWRTHFHVPIFVSHYGTLAATQSDIEDVLAIVKEKNITQHLEVETYTGKYCPLTYN